MNFRPFACFGLLSMIFCGCPGYNDCGSIVLPHRAFALTPLNSPFDDWNSCDPTGHFGWDREGSLIFSSNRATKGHRFDLTPMTLTLDGNDSNFTMSGGAASDFDSLLAVVNTENDELGPSFWFPPSSDPGQESSVAQAFVFSRGDSVSHDIYALVSPLSNDSIQDIWRLWDWILYNGKLNSRNDQVVPVLNRLPSPINTDFDEGYATWNPLVGKVLFHSNRSGTYRIWEATVPQNASGPFQWLRQPSDSGVTVRMIGELASPNGQERCPFLVGNHLYFVSDRPGGMGGFDVYQSLWDGTVWSKPENLGPLINSTSKEYRPYATQSGWNDQPNALIFSSDRPGGKGGFDLYMAGL